ncbi:MAG TPA: hypothetical protein VIM65_11830 [Cyclobacteriaceae bacterium]
MKSLNRLFLAITILTVICMSACKENDYLTDGGVYKAVSSLSTYDYLKSSSHFDTLILIVDYFGLKDALNEAPTTYAFTDYTAKVFMRSIDCTTMNQLYDSISSKFVTQYLFPEKIMVKDASVDPVIFQNLAEPDSTNCAISKAEYIEYVYLTNSTPGFKYYQMQYLNVNGVIDNSADAPADDPTDVTLKCQTSDILTSSGATVVHVFSNSVLLKKL